MSTPKIITFLPNPIPGNEKLPFLSNSRTFGLIDIGIFSQSNSSNKTIF